MDEFGEKTASVIVSATPAGHLVVQTRPVPGQPCPTCGKPYGKSQAQRSREWRERQKRRTVINGEETSWDAADDGATEDALQEAQ